MKTYGKEQLNFEEYTVGRLDKLTEDVSCIRTNVEVLKVRASIFGAIGGIFAVMLSKITGIGNWFK